MKDLLKQENIIFRKSATDWREAIKESIKPLIKQGYCEPEYVDEIFKNTAELGPYYVLCEDLALIHARGTNTVHKSQITVIILEQPTKFNENGLSVRVLIGLAAIDSESHMEALKVIAYIFSSRERINHLLDLKTAEEVFQYFLNSAEESNL